MAENKVEEWLEEFSSENTRKNYKSRLESFFNSTGLSEESLTSMSIDQIKHTLLVYRKDELAKGAKQNTILSIINSVRSFCVQLDKPIKFRRGALGKVEPDRDSHIFTNGDLKTLFEIGDTEEKAIISTATSLGWEISAFLSLDRETIRKKLEWAKANDMKFIIFEDVRPKTGESRLAVLNPLSIQWITKFLETRKDSDPRLFPYTPDGIQKMLNRLAVNSGLKTTGSLRFHNIRKWLMSRLSRAGFNEFQIKYILGKAIGVSDRTYLQTLRTEIEEKYPTVYNDYLNIVPAVNSEQIKKFEGLEQEVESLKKSVADLKTKNFLFENGLELIIIQLENAGISLVDRRGKKWNIRKAIQGELIEKTTRPKEDAPEDDLEDPRES